MFGSDDIAEFVRTRRAAPVTDSESTALPRFSVVMPSYRHASFIRRSILSVLNQNLPRTELIVIDGGSTDGTTGILEEYQHDLAYCVSEPDRGQSDALNKGFRRATGDIVGWLNSDDLYLPGAFRHAAEVFHRHPEVQVVYGDWYTIDAHDRVRERFLSLSPSRRQLITEGFFCNAQAMFWRRSLHEKLGEFDLRLHYTMDYDLMLRMCMALPARALRRTPRPLGCFRVYAGQKTGANDARVAAEHRLIAERCGTTWKYRGGGRLMRQLFRGKRIAEHLYRGRGDYLWSRVASRVQSRRSS